MTEKSHVALFCDEAGKETDRFLAVGGIIVTPSNADMLRRKFAEFLTAYDIKSEVKWNKINKGNKDKYHAITHFVFGLLSSEKIGFHCLLIDFDRFDHDLRPDGGKNESLKRMYYQLILHRLGKVYGRDASLYAFPDKARELSGLDGLKDGLNSVLASQYGYPLGCLKAIEFRNSQTEPLLQINDLLLGAVCYQKNKRFESEGAGHPKANFAGYVLGRAGLKDYNSDTPPSSKSFSIWNLKSRYLKGS